MSYHHLPRDMISNVLQIVFIIQQRSREYFNLIILMSYNFNNNFNEL